MIWNPSKNPILRSKPIYGSLEALGDMMDSEWKAINTSLNKSLTTWEAFSFLTNYSTNVFLMRN